MLPQIEDERLPRQFQSYAHQDRLAAENFSGHYFSAIARLRSVLDSCQRTLRDGSTTAGNCHQTFGVAVCRVAPPPPIPQLAQIGRPVRAKHRETGLGLQGESAGQAVRAVTAANEAARELTVAASVLLAATR
jgi:hypothetical protein